MLRFALALILSVPFALPAFAGHGRLEINQACATQTGCFPGDDPGFPVIITTPGSYVLTGDLSVADADLFVLDLRAPDVTVDLNGFAIRGPQSCGPAGTCSSSGGGHAVASFNVSPIPENISILNGTISGFSGCVVLAAARMRVQGLSVSHCTLNGIQVGGDGLVLDNRVSNVALSGLDMGANTAFRDNVVTKADLRRPGTSVAYRGGRAVGGNVCEDGSCTSDGSRRFYLTEGFFTGNLAGTACAEGFRIAALSEVIDTSNLTYDSHRGKTHAGIPGLPAENIGWMYDNVFSHCNNYSSLALTGTSVKFLISGEGSSVRSHWVVDQNRPCDAPSGVWCIERRMGE